MTGTRPCMLLVAWLAVLGVGMASGESAIYRCIGENDVPIFSDRTCSVLGASDHYSEFGESVALDPTSVRHDCSRRIDTLQTRVRIALETGDVNQLAGLYHWMDATMDAAELLMSEFKIISNRHLVNIEVESLELDGIEHPAMLWMDQYGMDRPGQTIRTGFSLVMASGCWWLGSR